MASDGVEVEIKIPVSEELFAELKNKLKSIANFKEASDQADDYYIPAHRDFLAEKYPFEWLRIRKKEDKFILTYKHYYPERAEENTHCDEYETKLEDPGQLENIFSALNFKKIVSVNKHRLVYQYKNEFEVVLDIVKELGCFIEVEAIKNFGSIQTTRQKLFEFAKALGINVSRADKRGYPYLMMKKKGLI